MTYPFTLDPPDCSGASHLKLTEVSVTEVISILHGDDGTSAAKTGSSHSRGSPIPFSLTAKTLN